MNLDLGSLMWAQLWQVTLLAIVVWGAVRWLAADRPHLAHALWLLVLIKCLTPPVLASPTSPFSWLQARNQTNLKTQSGAETSDFGATDSSRFANGSNVFIRTNLFQDNKRNKTDSGSIPSTAINNKPAETRSQIFRTSLVSWPIVFAAFWLGGAAINLIVTSIRFLLFWKLTCLRPAVAQPQLEQSVSKWSRELGLRQRVRIRVLDSPIGPAVVGLFRPLILLPLVLVEGRSEKDLKPLLAHELIHIRRGDLFWAMIQTLAGCLFWFHPLVRWGVRMVTQESERSCDEETVANLDCSPATYARCLLDVLELKQSLRVAPAVPGIRPVDITSNRMERIMKLGHGCQKQTPLWVWLVMLVSGSIVLPGAALVFGQDGEQASAGNLLPRLESEKVAATKPGNDSMMVGSYDVADLLKQADQFGDPNLKPSVKLLGAFPIRDRKANPHVQTVLYDTDSDGSVKEIKLGHLEPHLKVVGNRLCVFGTDEYRRSIQASLKRLRETGFKTIQIDMFLITADSKALKTWGLDWDSPKLKSESGPLSSCSAVETVGAITTMPEVKFDPNTLVDANFKQAAYEISLEASNEPEQFSSGIMADSYPNIDQVCSVPSKLKGDLKQVNALQRSHKVQYAIRSNAEVERLLFDKVKSNGTASLCQMPTITMFSGQTASIVNGSNRPFVVGMQNLAFGINQPKIGFVCDGMTTTLSAELQSNGSIRLSNKLVFSKIEGDHSLFFMGEPWTTDKPSTTDPYIEGPSVHVPIVSFVGFSSELEIPKDQTLILNTCLPEARATNTIPSLVFIRCRAIESESLKPYVPVPLESLSIQQLQKIAEELPVYQLQQFKPSPPTGTKAAETSGSATHPSKAENLPAAYHMTDDVQYRNRNLPSKPTLANASKSLNKREERKNAIADLELAAPLIHRLFRNTEKTSPQLVNRNGEYFVTDSSEKLETSVNPIVIVQSMDENKNHTSENRVEKLNNGVELRLETDVDRENTEGGTLLRGEQLKFRIMDHMEFSCEKHGELDFKNENQFVYRGQGKVLLNAIELNADFVELTQSPGQFKIELQGNANCCLEGNDLRAERIKVFESSGAIFLEGNASVNREGEAGLKGDKIKVLGDIILLEGNANVTYLEEQQRNKKASGKTILYNIPVKNGAVIEL